ncbi:MAG: family 16 glycoside hydrolase [Planctomycetota bacterium]
MATLGLLTPLYLFTTPAFASEVIFQDDFNRQEADESKESVGNGWSTNSRGRAEGNKQADLREGALYIYRHKVADHGVSVVHDAEFKDAVIKLRFKIGKGDELGVNIADMKEKSVHAGHILVTRVNPNQFTLQDLKTGQMNLELRERRKADKATEEDKNLVKAKRKIVKRKTSLDTWHNLEITIRGETLSAKIDGKEVGSFTSKGIGHPTKRRIRLAVKKNAWVDDLSITRL